MLSVPFLGQPANRAHNGQWMVRLVALRNRSVKTSSLPSGVSSDSPSVERAELLLPIDFPPLPPNLPKTHPNDAKAIERAHSHTYTITENTATMVKAGT